MANNFSKDWSSTIVILSLMTTGTAFTATSCQPGWLDPEGVQNRNLYQSREACVADYSEQACESFGSGGTSGVGYYHRGPLYPENWRSRAQAFDPAISGPGRAALTSPDGIVAHPTQTTRGGFGSTGRSYSFRGG